MDVRQYPPIKDKWVLKPFKMLLEYDVSYEVTITDQFKSDQDWCEVSIDVQKQYEDYNGGIAFEGKMTSGFKIKNKKKNITPEMLFDLLKIAGLNFTKSFAGLVKGTSLEGAKIPRPEFEHYEKYLSQVIRDSK
jgi:hypothetical protein